MTDVRRRPRLVHVTTSDMSLDWLLGPQLRAFAEAGFEVIGVSAPGPHVESLRAQGIAHVGLPSLTRSMAPTSDLRALLDLRTLFRQLGADIVHTHNPKPGIYGRLAARAAGVPAIVNTVHGLYALPEDRRAKRWPVYGLERLAVTCSDAELVQNEEDLATLRRLGVPSSKLHLLGNGVDLERFSPGRSIAGRALRAELGIGPDEVVVGAVGRLVWEKGYREVFEAARQLVGRAQPVRVLVAGPSDPDKADAVDADAMARAEAGGVTFLGRRDDVEALYAALDIYVLASYREGFPRSAMEAAATGLPIVATDIRGCRQVVRSGETGLLVPPRDASALAGALSQLVDDSIRRRAMGEAAARLARAEFDQQRVIDLTLETYRRLGGRRRASAR